MAPPSDFDLGLLVEHNADAVLLVQADGTVRYANAAAADAFGQSASNLVGTALRALVHDGDWKTVAALLPEEAPIDDAPAGEVVTFRGGTEEGQGRWFEGRANVLPDANVLLTLRDVTRRILGRGATDVFRSAVQQASESILITEAKLDRPGPRIVYVNPAFTTMTGYTEDDVIGRTPRILQGPGTERAVLDRLRERLSAGKMFQGEILNYRKDGTAFVMEWQVAPIRDAAGTITHWVATQHDVTDRKQTQEQIVEASARVQRRIAQDLHDGLGQHLLGLTFLARALEQDLSARDDPKAADAAQITGLAQQAVNQTRRLARGLFPVNLEQHGLAMALQDLAAQVEDVFDVSCRFEGDEVEVTNDVTAMHLYRIAQEAVNNAVRHADPEAVMIQLHRAADAPSWAELVVSDDGTGIPEEALDNGGLGLRILQFRTSMIDGHLTVEPRATGGTAVRCRFDPKVVPEHHSAGV